jgi:4-amino-4-deoxy-L-arabinose transferase-like glycosyltransferase
MNPRELLRLAPLLGVYFAALAFFPQHPDDEASYITLAERLTHGAYVTGDSDALLDPDPTSPDLWFGPGLPGALAPLTALHAPTEVLRATGPLFLFAAVLLFYVLARREWGPGTSVVASYAFGLYPPFWPLLTNVHSEPLAIMLVVAAMLGLALSLERATHASVLLTSAALAALAMTRVAYGWVLTITLLASALFWLLTRSRKFGVVAAITGIALIVSIPWLAYTYSKTDRLLVWGNSGALSLYWMSSPFPGDQGDWRQADDVFTDPGLRSHRRFFTTLRGLPLGEQNASIEREALKNIAEHPVAYAGNIVANGSRLLFNVPYSDSAWQANDLFYAIPNIFVLAAIVLCLTVLVPRRRALPPESSVFALIGFVGLTLHLLVSAYPRMLAPLIPLLAWLTTLAIVEGGVSMRVMSFRRRRPQQTATSAAGADGSAAFRQGACPSRSSTSGRL